MPEQRDQRIVGPSLFFGAGFLAFAFLLGGLQPVYMFERERTIVDIEERCPGPPGSEASFDENCAVELIRDGPLMLGAGYFVAAFAFGIFSIAGLWLACRRPAARIVVAASLVLYLVGWIAALEWNASEAHRLTRQDFTIYP